VTFAILRKTVPQNSEELEVSKNTCLKNVSLKILYPKTTIEKQKGG
jgi:hypothetical protein